MIRTLTEKDIPSLLEVLEDLSTVGDIPRDTLDEAVRAVLSNPWHTILVAEEDGNVVGAGTILIEQKFIHGGGKLAHIEDIVVRREWRKRSIGRDIMESLIEIARQRNCYRILLNCDPDRVEGFYQGIGFHTSGVEMRMELPAEVPVTA